MKCINNIFNFIKQALFYFTISLLHEYYFDDI